MSLQGAGGGRAAGARPGDEKEEIQQQRKVRPTVRTASSNGRASQVMGVDFCFYFLICS